MNSPPPTPSETPLSRQRLFLEWMATFAALCLTTFAIYSVEDYLQEGVLPSLWVPVAILLLIAPSAAALFSLLLPIHQPFRDHARIYLMMTCMTLGGTAAKVYVGKGPHLVGAILGVLVGAAVWWVIWRPKLEVADSN